MAAKLPAGEVLREATSYLDKLGSNLQARSQSLRDKKIRKEKLNNVLALQKAAKKVLLICELSKKSLENVENGVRDVLKQIESQQSSQGDKTTKSVETAHNLQKESKYFYFEYKSRKLRIKNKISVKHYTSVKVVARSIPQSMINKYPVYYDCKLYRLRKKEEKMQNLKQNISEDSEIKSIDKITVLDSKDSSNLRKIGHIESVITVPNSPTSVRKIIEDTDIDTSTISILDTPDSKSQNKGEKKDNSHSQDNLNTNLKVSKARSLSMNSSEFQKDKNLENDSDKMKSIDRRKSENSITEKKKTSIDDGNSCKKKFKKLIVLDDSSDEEKTSLDKNSSILAKDIEELCPSPKHKKRKLSESLDNDQGDVKDDENSAQIAVNAEDIDVGGEINKPLIKCVSLSKLLKPDVLVKSGINPKNQNVSPRKEKSNKNIPKSKLKSEDLNRKQEREYWEQKRIEISSFKPKEFFINITRLPELSNAYLNMLCLKRISCEGKTICEILDKNTEFSKEINSSCELDTTLKSYTDESEIRIKNTKASSKSYEDNQTKEIKSSLLNDSESEDNDLIAVANKVKHSLLNESESDCDFVDINRDVQITNKKKEMAKSSDQTDSEHTKNNKGDNDNGDTLAKAKNDLLHNSESDKGSDVEPNLHERLFYEPDESETTNQDNVENTDNAHSEKGNHGEKTEKSYSTEKIKTQAIDKKSEMAKKSVPTDSEGTEMKRNNNGDTLAKAKNDLLHDSESDKVSDEELHLNYEIDESQILNQDIVDNTEQSQSKNDSNKEKAENLKSKDLSEKKGAQNENLSQNVAEEKTPEKECSQKDGKDKVELNTPAVDKTNTPLSQRRISNSLTPQSKKKRIRESMHAKKMLLTYSSSSDTDDEKLKNVLKEIKDSLLHGSDEEKNIKMRDSKSNESSSSDDMIKNVKKKILEDSDEKSSKYKRKKRRPNFQCQDSNEYENPMKTHSRKMVRSKSKPGNCSSQNSDAQDSNDKDIDGLTNLNTLNKSHRRQSHDTEESSGSNMKAHSEKKKPTGLICQEMLKAESSSDEASGDDNEAVEEELPTVTIPNFNGVEHMVKEDLLEESESSESHNEDANKEDSESEERQQSLKRRKANAISSDSEVGSSRKKDHDADVKLSDFEDSEDDTSETGKRKKRKKKGSDSDSSAGLSSSEGGKKKRRRIKTIKDSDVSGSESETEGRNKHGRKNIRKVMGKNQLEEATKKAAREEKERIARIAERQKLYNNLEFDESGKPDDVVLEKVVLDFDPETKEPLIEVDRGLVKKLKPHQANGIKFMWDACFESVKRIKKDRGSGCILAHCMGLGKTLQVVTLTHTLLTHGDLTRVNRVLVVCPLSTVLNWVNEFRMWLKHAVTDYDVEVYELSRYKQNSERAFQLSQWFEHGGVCVLGYEMFRNLSADNVKKFKKKMLKNFQESLVDPGPDLVVCDEGHLLKNEKTSLSQSMNRVRTRRRIVLTGTPLQNNLKEYYCMVQFVKPNLLGKYNEYLNRFVNPITNGQYTDSTEHDIKIMKRRSHVLHKMLDGAVQRRDYGVLAPFLPPKHEYVLFITLSEVQTKLYQHYLDNFSRKPLPGKSSGFLFPDFQSLQRIWTHPLVLKYNSERYEIMQQKKRDKEEEEDSEGSLVNFINDESTAEETTTEESSDDSSEMSDDSRKKGKNKKKSNKKSKHKEARGEGPARPRRGTRANPIDQDEDDGQDDVIEVKNENPTEWWIRLVEEEELEDMRNSHKLILLFDILRQCETIGDKLLVFSQSLYSLDLIEHFLGKVDEATQEGRIDEKLGGHVGSWSPGVDYFRLDGSTSCENRSIWCKNFNREDNPRARLFLISTRAGGLGINLVAANRVVIFDVSWNPSHDVQSIFRVYRFGQKKPCYVYRFLAMGTMEEKIYERQVTKQAISKRVIDEQQIDRHYAENDLAELYKFEPHPPSPRPIPPLPKDRLFAEMLREHEPQIYKYHEHDSLLENKEEETLSEEERKAAWEDFENEKNRPPPPPFVSPWAMHNGMVPGLLAQQQMAAYAGLANMLRKDVPNINEEQIRTMASLLYNTNPQMFGGYDYGMMQKMNELLKYSQPGMMNPGMMNPGVMNPASGAGAGAGAGAGGSSGLQYEPPWQRQQQHQHQMRLQQLMQHQNQMGAKFYAGGLGSRDPVAMALQQQRAREIMVGGSSSARPRGRPPLQPRVPLHPHDVVNLDSD